MQNLPRRTVLGLALAPAWFSTFAQSEHFPNGTVNIVVPLAPGDAADTSVRVLAEELAKTLGTSVVVTNRRAPAAHWARMRLSGPGRTA